ncbi:very short patch repair endonuclease [Thalassobaculum sp. OXR-137]|nr:very short patch repair endonuclease [Thalassobaculum sp. OXR-137]WPZ37037.1 very short patch repair endonuclease [Thalassobaculum sp. OXR-137]
MQAIRQKNTKPEMAVRRLLHALGYRYRVHRTDLPGRPDIVFTARKKIVQVHGCFWHGHDCLDRMPKSREEYWLSKIQGNRERDERNRATLEAMGWEVLVVWECEIKNTTVLASTLTGFLGPARVGTVEGRPG